MRSLHSERFLMCLPILLSLLLLPRSLLAISCNFEIDLCEWENGMVGPQWIQGSWKGPNSTNQGPMYDHTINQRGHYLFVSPAPSGGSKGPARLTSILQTATACDQCFSFWYHMYGPKIGYLSLKVRQQGRREELLWTRTATQGNEWKRGFQTIASQLKHFQLIFEASQTDGGGDIAIDDISVVGGACEPQQMCNFEANSCEFTSTGAQTWRREQGHSGETTNRPAIDITTETGQGHYMLADTSQGTLPRGQAVLLVSPSQVPRDVVCLQFWMQANVESSGTLNIYVEEDLQGKRLVWGAVIAPLLTWRLGRVRIHTAQSWKLVFEAVGGGSSSSYIAIDDVMLMHTECPRMGACSFEDGLCGWRNVLDPSKDVTDWTWSSGKAPSHFTAPSTDHTLGTAEGHYMFVDTQVISAKNWTRFLSEHLPPTKGSCLTFHYHTNVKNQLMHGPLKVVQYVPDRESMLWEAKDDQKEWRVVNITVDSAMEFQVAFIAMKSDHAQTGYVAIDDIEYRPGVNCYGVVTDIVVGGAGNTAGIVAAVILVLAALVCLAVATNHWYKNRSVCFRGSTDESSAPFGFDNISYRNRDKNTVPVETVQGPGIADRQ